MVKRTKLWVVGAILLAIGGTVVASNMGFKFVPNANEGGSAKTHTISFPLNNNYANAKEVYDDIQGSAGCSALNVIRISTNLGVTTYAGVPAVNNFPIVKGVGYEFKVGGAGCTNWVIVGSHDPSFAYSFPVGGAAQSYLTSIPYHTTAANAKELYDTIPNALNVIRISRNLGKTTYAGVPAVNNFPVVIGDAYVIKVSAASSWTPAHY